MNASLLPSVIFLHGYLESPAIWPAFLGEYFHEYHVLTPALPGYGPDSATDYSLEAPANAVRTELTTAGRAGGPQPKR